MPKKAVNFAALAIAVVIAIAGIAVGGYFAAQPHGVTTQTVTSATTATSVATTTATFNQPTLVTVTGTASPSVSTITVGGAASDPQGIAFNPANNEIYVALENSSSVAVINAATNTLLTTIPLASGDAPVALAYDSANGMIYVANLNSKTCNPPAIALCAIPVINTATNTVATNIPTPDTTNGIAVNTATSTVYAASNDDDAMFFINTATNALTLLQIHTSIPDNAQSVALDASKNLAFIGNYYGKRTSAQLGFLGLQSGGGCESTNTNSSFCITKTLGIDGGQITGVGVDPNTGFIYLANYKANLVNVISESTGKDVANITAPSPYSLAVDPNSNLVYVASEGTNSLLVISGSTNTLLGTVPVGTGPMAVAVDTNTNTVYVSNSVTGTVSGIDGTSLLF